MKTLFITSCLDLYYKDEHKNKIPHNFGNQNQILTNLKKYIKAYDNMLMITSDEFNTEVSDIYANNTVKSFNLTLPFKNYTLLDCRNEDHAKELIDNADFIFLMGGHVPTQNQFFNNIKLKELLADYNGVVLGVSAGSMNSAKTVYCPPELEGEGLDINFKRFFPGLNLTNINIFPHYDIVADIILDGKKMIEYAIEDSIKTPILLLPNGSYFIQKDNGITLYGKAYRLYNKNIDIICENEKTAKINNNLDVICELQ